jgi:hypothetical protein
MSVKKLKGESRVALAKWEKSGVLVNESNFLAKWNSKILEGG